MDKACSVPQIISLIKVALSREASLNFKTTLKINLNLPVNVASNAFDN